MNIPKLLTLALFVCACGSGEEFDGPFGQPGFTLSLDPEMESQERELVTTDYERLQELQIDGTQIKEFQNYFGGQDVESVLSFIDLRINYLLPRHTNIFRKIRINGQSLPDNIVEVPSNPRILASNDGVWLWLLNEAESARVQLRFGNQLIELDSSRVGIITLGPGYDSAAPRMLRVGTHVHEARHSDCTGGITEADLARFASGELPSNKACGHVHVDCPPGHELEGYAACDDHAWGAYAAGLLFAGAVAETCTNCTEEEIQLSMAIAADSATRILPLDEMLSGRLGSPNMKSAGVIGGN